MAEQSRDGQANAGQVPDRTASDGLHALAVAVGQMSGWLTGRTAADAGVQTVERPALPPRLQVLYDAYIAECNTAPGPGVLCGWMVEGPALSSLPAGKALAALKGPDKALVAIYAYAGFAADPYNDHASFQRRLVSDMLRGKIELSVGQAVTLAQLAALNGFLTTSFTPNQAVAGTLVRHVESQGLAPELREALRALLDRMERLNAGQTSEGRKLKSQVEAMLARGEAKASGADGPTFSAVPDVWGRALTGKLETLSPRIRSACVAMLALASKGGGAAKPTKGWLKLAAAEIDTVGGDRIGPVLLDLIELYEPAVIPHGGGSSAPISVENQNTLRGCLWLAAMAAAAGTGRRLEAYAQKCLTFDAVHFQYLSLVLGNATIHAFSLMPGMTGVGSLSRLKRRLKRPGEIKTVEKAIIALAEARGTTSAELEEIGLPDYGFAADGILDTAVGPASVRLRIDESGGLDTSWTADDGRPLSGPPAAVKSGFASALKAHTALGKEIAETLKAQRLRLERLYIGERRWTVSVWRERYLAEPLVSHFARRLVWSFEIDGIWVTGLPSDDPSIHDVTGAAIALAPTTRVRLWHPMQSDSGLVLAWRQRLQRLGVTQPFKQAHREVYVLTDAERTTELYSNRFAGHIVEQKLFRALAQTRVWNCPTYGSWCNGGAQPTKRLTDLGLDVVYHVDPIDETMGDDFQVRHLSTGELHFRRTNGESVPLAMVDPVLFSEMLRDCDLFVGVASIANDPNWQDRGIDEFGAYWQRTAFGELTPSAQTRRSVLADLLPGLSIAPRCRLDGRALVVEGKLRTYRIHLGSGNIQMEPNDQYLCIVEARKAHGQRVWLPFEGDQTLSLILSKAFMLVDDDTIKDPSIKSQIRQGLPRT